MKVNEYPRYKNSGSYWLGEIPEHWRIHRLKWTIKSCSNGIWGEEPDGVDDIICVRVADFDRSRFAIKLSSPTKRAISGTERRERLLQEGDLLIEKSGGGDLQPVGAVVLYDLDIPAVCSNFIARMKIVHDWNQRFLTYLHAHLYSSRVNRRSIKQTTGIQNLDLAAYLNEVIPKPSVDEQLVIASFLDCETARVDALIEKKQRQIELLQEKRAALISHAVTKGLNPNAKMKDSGIEWLGEIPEHWTVAPLYSRFQLQLGKMLDNKRITGEQLAPYLRNVDIQWGRINVKDLPSMDFTAADRARYSVKIGDLLVCEGGEIGRTAVWDGEISECFYQKALHRLRPLNCQDHNRFFYYVMFAAVRMGVFLAGADSSTIGHLTGEKLRRHRFAFPPRQEQIIITKHLDRETAKCSQLQQKIEESIDILQEYRTALISAAVTGKIDVRKETSA